MIKDLIFLKKSLIKIYQTYEYPKYFFIQTIKEGI